MVVTITYNDFKLLNRHQGNQILYVKVDNVGVTKCIILYDSSRAGMIFTFTNPPSKANFVSEYPGATQIDDLV